MGSDNVSYITILKPREVIIPYYLCKIYNPKYSTSLLQPAYTESSRITTDFLIELEVRYLLNKEESINNYIFSNCQSLIDRNKWESRREFFFQTLAFCLSLPNLWRFPREALTQGHGKNVNYLNNTFYSYKF